MSEGYRAGYTDGYNWAVLEAEQRKIDGETCISQQEETELRRREALEQKQSLGNTNDPKREAGSKKVPLDNISLVAQYYEAAVMAQGATTYGAYNWCDHSMKASTYYNAILRHLNAWWGGEDIDPKSGLPHMAHIRANTGIILDQQEAGRLIDDRPKNLAPIEPVVEKILAILHSGDTSPERGGFTDGNGRKVIAGDCVEYEFENHRRGVLIEALQDGDAFVKWDDGIRGQVKWRSLAKIP